METASTIAQMVSQTITWPVVVLIGILLLTLTKKHQELVKGIAQQILSFKGAVSDLRETGEVLKDRVSNLDSKSRDIMERLSGEIAALEGRITGIQDNLRRNHEKISEFIETTEVDNISITSQRISEETSNLEIAIAGEIEELRAPDDNPVDHTLSLEAMWREMQSSWDSFTDAFADRYTHIDRRKIGTEALALSDRRRRDPLSDSDAKLISDLHTQYKRFLRVRSKMEDWLTPDVYRSFCEAVRAMEASMRRATLR